MATSVLLSSLSPSLHPPLSPIPTLSPPPSPPSSPSLHPLHPLHPLHTTTTTSSCAVVHGVTLALPLRREKGGGEAGQLSIELNDLHVQLPNSNTNPAPEGPSEPTPRNNDAGTSEVDSGLPAEDIALASELDTLEISRVGGEGSGRGSERQGTSGQNTPTPESSQPQASPTTGAAGTEGDTQLRVTPTVTSRTESPNPQEQQQDEQQQPPAQGEDGDLQSRAAQLLAVAAGVVAARNAQMRGSSSSPTATPSQTSPTPTSQVSSFESCFFGRGRVVYCL